MAYWFLGADTSLYKHLLPVDKNRLWLEDRLGIIKRSYPRKHSDSWQPFQVRFLRDEEVVRAIESPELPTDLLIGNFSSLSGLITCDAVAREALEPLVGQMVEFLPLDCLDKPQQTLWLLNVLNVAECLDYERSEFTYWENEAIKAVRHYAFQAGCLDGQHIFRLPLFNYVEIYVSDEFKRLTEQHGLTGLYWRLAPWETQTD